MPTIIGTTQRLELNQSSRVPTKELLSGENLVFWQGLSSQIECALFNDTPEAASLIDISNLQSVNIVVRKDNASGNILFTEEVSAFTPITYNSWVAGTAAQFTFSISELDTTQIVPQSRHLPIYFVITAITNDNVPYIAGFGYGEIVDVGFIENPVASDYINGRTPIVGGKLLSNFDLNGFRIVDSSGLGYTEEGFEILTDGQLEVNVDFTFEKAAADGYRFDYYYIKDSNAVPSDVRPILTDQTTTGFTMELSAGAVAGTTLYWKVIPKDTITTPNPIARYADISNLRSISAHVFYASRFGAVLDSNVVTGGGTDDTVALNAALSALGDLGGGTFILDGAALISAELREPDNVTIYVANKNCGVFLAAGSNCPMLVNSNFATSPNPHEPVASQRQKNISVIGGTWNGNCLNQSIYVDGNIANPWVCGMWFNGVDNLFIKEVTILDARKFALMITFPHEPTVIDYTAEWPEPRFDNNDGIHFWGPVTGRIYGRNWTFRNSCDDCVAFNFCESADTGNGGTFFSATTTASTATNTFTSTGHELRAGLKVRFRTTGTLPAGLTTTNEYFILASGLTANAFKVSITASGAEIDITSAGTGTLTWYRDAAVSTYVDGIFNENGSAGVRIDGRFASAGDITIANHTLNLSAASTSALTLIAEGTWKKLYMPGWNVNIPAGIPADIVKGVHIKHPANGSITMFKDWLFTGDSSISVIDGLNNAFVTVTLGYEAPAHQLIIDNCHAKKPTPTRNGGFVYLRADGLGTPQSPSLKHITISRCSMEGYAFLFANDFGADVCLSLNTGNNNQLNGGLSSTGSRPPTILDVDELGIVAVEGNLASDYSLTSGVPAYIPLTVENYDTNGFHSSGTPSEFVAPQTGFYDFGVSVPFQQNGTGYRDVGIYHVPTGTFLARRLIDNPLAGDITLIEFTTIFRHLNAGDIVKLRVHQASGGNLVIHTEGARFVMALRK